MTAKTVTCIEIACDVCGEHLDEQGEGSRQHFNSVADAATGFKPPQEQEHWIDEWIVWPDGYSICPSDDGEHQAAREPLRPKPPVEQIPGQTEITMTAAQPSALVKLDECWRTIKDGMPGIDVEVRMTQPAPGPYVTDAFVCPHGVTYWLMPTEAQIAQWVRDGVA